MNVVVAASKTDADTVLHVGEGIVVDIGVKRLQDGNAGVLHVVHVVVCPAAQIVVQW